MRSLTLKLSLAFLLISLIGVGLVALLTYQSTRLQFNQFVVDQDQAILIAQLSDYYQTNGSWAGVEDDFPLFVRRQHAQGMMQGNMPAAMAAMRQMAVVDENGRIVAPGLGFSPRDRVPDEQLQQGIPIEVEGQEVGRLLVGSTAFQRGLREAERLFLNRIGRFLIISALTATAVSVLLGVLLARSLTRPVQELTTATRAIARGDLSQQVPIRSQDELGELAASFNQMSQDLSHASHLRRQMTADIAHELRTPLSIVLGHAEALRDGVLPATPENLDIIRDEASRLNHLIDDLRTLSLAEAGELPTHPQPVPPHSLLEPLALTYANTPQARQQDITITTRIEPNLPLVQVDPDRMVQVLGNLLSNALRYTPANGKIELVARHVAGRVQLAVRDSGPGIPPEDLPHVFDRFYRGDKSRRRHEGGSGLGLAIARSLVEGANGRIWAESSPGNGTTIFIELPAIP